MEITQASSPWEFVLKAKVKYGTHPSTLTMGEVCNALKFLFGGLIKMKFQRKF